MCKEQTDESSWFETKQIETFVGKMKPNMTDEEMKACKKKLIVLHQCGNDKEALISQLKTMLHGIETDFDQFAS